MSPEISLEASQTPERKVEQVEKADPRPVETAAKKLERAKETCAPLKDSLRKLKEDYPNLQTEAFQDEVENLLASGELHQEAVAHVADALDNLAFSTKGEEKFNTLVEDGNTLTLCETLMNNHYAIERLKLTELPDKAFDKVVNAATDLTWIQLSITKGEVFTGYGVNETPSALVVGIYNKPKTAGQAPATNSAGSSKPSVEVNPFGTISATQQEELVYASEYDDARIAENKAALEEEYKEAFEETGVSIEEFLAEKGLDYAGRPINQEE